MPWRRDWAECKSESVIICRFSIVPTAQSFVSCGFPATSVAGNPQETILCAVGTIENRQMITLPDLHSAQSRLQGITTRTRLIEFNHETRVPHVSHPLRDMGTLASRRLFLKPENQQPIGAFKLRGAYNKIASLSDAERKRGVISYSSGNHAQGVAYAARALNVKAVIVMPNNAPAIKREATAKLGAEIVLVGPGSDERKSKAEE